MNLTPYLTDAADIALSVAVPIGLLLLRRGLQMAQQKLQITVSEADQRALEAAIGTGAGVLRAKLASGEIALPEIRLGGPHINHAAAIALEVGAGSAHALGISKEAIAAQIVARVGHALGDDPGVQSVLRPPAAEALSPSSPPVAPVA